MKTCDEILDLISARLDGALSPGEEAALAEHLAACPDCAALAADLEAIHAELPGLNEEPPAFIMENVMAQIRSEPSAPIPFPAQKARSHWRKWGATAAVLALLTAGALYLNPFGGYNAAPVTADIDETSIRSYSAQSAGGLDGAAPASAPAPIPSAAPQARAVENGMEDTTAANHSETESPAATVPPSASPAPRISTMMVTGAETKGSDTALTQAEACRRLYEARFAADYPDAEVTDTGAVLGEQTLTYLGQSANGAYLLFALTGRDDTADTFAVPVDSTLPILSQREDEERFPDA